MFAPDFRTIMKVAKTLTDFVSARKSLGDKTVGFVPTMGALHEGHASLIRRAVATPHSSAGPSPNVTP